MIKNAKLLALSLSSLFILTACGGGGGGSSDSGVSVNQPPKPSATTKLEIDGGVVNIKDNKITNKKYTKPTREYGSGALVPLFVDGVELEYAPYVNIGSAGGVVDSPQGLTHKSYVEYGIRANENYVNANGIHDDIYLEYQGEVTPEKNIPKTGKITYRNDLTGVFAINENINKSGFNSTDRFTSRGTSTITADFDKKEVNGVLVHKGLQNSPYFTKDVEKYHDTIIYGKITGNKFAGEKNNVSAEGKFFGPNAEAIAGTFHDKNQKLHGVFGGKK